MKKLITLLFVLALSFSAFSQQIIYKQTSIAIQNDGGFSTNDNSIRCIISADVVDAEALQGLFPSKKFTLQNGKLVNAGMLPVASMWDLINTMVIEQSDVDKTGIAVIKTWSVNIIYQMNLLDLTLEDWSIVE
jgi:hypothetical protein